MLFHGTRDKCSLLDPWKHKYKCLLQTTCLFQIRKIMIRNKLFKNGPCKLCEIKILKIWKDIVRLNGLYQPTFSIGVFLELYLAHSWILYLTSRPMVQSIFNTFLILLSNFALLNVTFNRNVLVLAFESLQNSCVTDTLNNHISPYSLWMRENAEKARTRITPNTENFYDSKLKVKPQ